MERNVFASTDNYMICKIVDDDREDYTKLHIQLNGENSFYNNPRSKDLMWEATINGQDEVYSIFDRNRKYCGSIEVQYPLEKHPEIGIDLLENMRNKGIASQVIRIFVKEYARINHKEYFVVRILSKNNHSQHVFEKIGAELIREEKSDYENMINMLKVSVSEENAEKVENLFRKNFADEGSIRVYKLVP